MTMGKNRIDTRDHKARYAERKEKIREYNLKRDYGITVSDYNILFESQNYKCVICGSENSKGSHKHFHVDHDHKTGRVRGLLCFKCNSLLGQANDDCSILQNAIDYLKHHE